MKYIVTTFHNEQEITVTVSCRWDAHNKTLFKKCAQEMHHKLCEMRLTPDRISFGYDLPSVWRNGAVGALWFDEPYFHISIEREDGCTIAW